MWSIDTDEFRGDCTTEPDTFVDFYNSLKELRRNPYFKEVLPELDMNAGTYNFLFVLPKYDLRYDACTTLETISLIIT